MRKVFLAVMFSSGSPDRQLKNRHVMLFWLLLTLGLAKLGGAESNQESNQQVVVDVAVSVALQPGPTSFQLPSGELRLRARALDGDAEKKGLSERSLTLQVAPGTNAARASTKLRPEIVWELALEAEGLWAQPAIFFLDKAETTVTIRAWPTGTVSAALKPPPDHPLPETVRARFSETPRPLRPDQLPDEREPPAFEGETTCKVEKATVSCPLVAGKVDFSLHSKGFVAHYFWETEVKPGATRALGSLKLVPGASLSGWVVVGSGSGKVEQATVEIGPPPMAFDPDWASAARFQQLTQKVKPNARGFFQLEGVAPGGYTLSAHLEGYAPAGPFQLQVVEKLETRVKESLILNPPEQLDLFIDPPLAPGDRPWRVRYAAAQRIPGAYGEMHEKAVSETGWTRLEGLHVGKYLLLITGPGGDPWHGEELTVERNPSPHHVELDIVKVRGRVRLGKKPLPSVLWFGGRFGAPKIKLIAGSNGTFEGLLPREGRWQLDVIASKPKTHRRLNDVEVRREQNQPTAFVEIALPATRVAGVVVDENGKPAEQAFVRIVSLETQPREAMASVPVDPDAEGRFEAEGFSPGSLMLFADAGEFHQSERVIVEVPEDGASPEVRLVLRPMRRIEGRVVAPGGQPVPGAAVDVTPLDAGLTFVESAAARFDGSFVARVGAKVQRVSMTVAAPGFALRSMIVSLDDRPEIVVAVDQIGGTLELALPATGEEETESSWPVLYNAAGVSLGLQQLTSWAILNGEPPEDRRLLRVPNVEGGQYTLCLATPGEQLSLTTQPPSRHCTAGYLPPLGSLQLVLDSPPGS